MSEYGLLDQVAIGEPTGATQNEASDDIRLLEQFRWFRMKLTERLCSASEVASDGVLNLLRQEPVLNLAEFYFLLSHQGIRQPDDVERLAQLHNEYVVKVTKDAAKLKRLGLSCERLLESMFTADTLPRLVENWRERPGTIDQSNLARFLCLVMSAETCRKIVVACADAGFLERHRTAYGTYLVRSNGSFETIFANTLREARTERWL